MDGDFSVRNGKQFQLLGTIGFVMPFSLSKIASNTTNTCPEGSFKEN